MDLKVRRRAQKAISPKQMIRTQLKLDQFSGLFFNRTCMDTGEKSGFKASKYKASCLKRKVSTRIHSVTQRRSARGIPAPRHFSNLRYSLLSFHEAGNQIFFILHESIYYTGTFGAQV